MRRCLVLVLFLFAPFAAAQVTQRIDFNPGVPGSGDSLRIQVNEDGRWVTFTSLATNLVPGDTNGIQDVFAYDRLNRTWVRVNIDPNGQQAQVFCSDPAISGNGRYVAFTAPAHFSEGGAFGADQIYRRDLWSNTTEKVSTYPSGLFGTTGWDSHLHGRCMTTEGNCVLDSIEPFDTAIDLNDNWDVYLKDMTTGAIELISQDTAGTGAQSGFFGAVSADGNRIAFESNGTSVVPGDSNGANDIFLRDRQAQTTTRVSLGSAGNEANGDCQSPSISRDGEYVIFHSAATNLVPGDTNNEWDVFLVELATGNIERVNVSTAGVQANGYSGPGDVSDDGRYVVFASSATNLVPGDTNGAHDVFIRDRLLGTTRRVSVDNAGAQAPGISDGPTLNSTGSVLVFHSDIGFLGSTSRGIYTRGPELNLILHPDEATSGETITVDAFQSQQSSLGALFVTAVNGTPFLRMVLLQRFDALGRWSNAFVVPADPQIVGLDVTFRMFGFGFYSGSLQQTDPDTIRLR